MKKQSALSRTIPLSSAPISAPARPPSATCAPSRILSSVDAARAAVTQQYSDFLDEHPPAVFPPSSAGVEPSIPSAQASASGSPATSALQTSDAPCSLRNATAPCVSDDRQPPQPLTSPPASSALLTSHRAARETRKPHQAYSGVPGYGPPTWDRFRFLPALPDERSDVAVSVARRPPRVRRRAGTTQRTPHELNPLASAHRMVPALVSAAAEVLAGLRPADHLSHWTTTPLYTALSRRAGLARRILGERSEPHPRVRRYSIQLTPSGACEATVLLEVGARLRGAAARLEMRRGRWVLAAFEMG